jgi:hypothetical protein
MLREILIFLFYFFSFSFAQNKKDEIILPDLSDSLSDLPGLSNSLSLSNSLPLSGSQSAPLSHTYSPEIFNPFDEFFGNISSRFLFNIHESVSINLDEIERGKWFEIYFEKIQKILEMSERYENELKEVEEKIQTIINGNKVEREAEDGKRLRDQRPPLLNELYDEIEEKFMNILDGLERFRERITTLNQLSRERIKQGSSRQRTRESIELFLTSFQEELTEFETELNTNLQYILQSKELNSETFYSFESESEFEEMDEIMGGLEDESHFLVSELGESGLGDGLEGLHLSGLDSEEE